jgi:hypothetical protein
MQIAFIEFLYRDHIMLDYLVKFKNDFFELVYASRVREDFLSWVQYSVNGTLVSTLRHTLQ